MDLYAIILAGGIGSRFWPKSREKHPKQLLNLFAEETLIQSTVQRLNGLVKNENIYIVTGQLHKTEIEKQLPAIPNENIIAEPFGRNTSACIALASLYVKKRNPKAVTVVLPADHIIKEVDLFQKTVCTGAEFAEESNGLVTIGLTPTRPETGFGYIQIDDDASGKEVFPVKTFAEKPNYDTAVRFVESGDFLWNSGIFIWRIDAILSEFRIHMPELFAVIRKFEAHIDKENFEEVLLDGYGHLRNISIDYGIMENSRKVYLTKGAFSWYDVGNWEEVYQLAPKDEHENATKGNVFAEDVKDSFIYSDDSFAAVMGVENLIIVNTKDALLVCDRSKAQDVKKIVDFLKHNQKSDFL